MSAFSYMFLYLILIISVFSLASGFYSMHYYYNRDLNHPKVITPNGPMQFKNTPSSEQVADLYLRSTGNNPILKEGFFLLIFFII